MSEKQGSSVVPVYSRRDSNICCNVKMRKYREKSNNEKEEELKVCFTDAGES